MARDRNYIGSYRLLKLVRAGATCQIWEVYDEINDRRCALKTPQEEHRDDRQEIALLKHEFLVGESLKNKNVIEFYDCDSVKGIPYLAMEYFESSNLKQWFRAEAETEKLLDWLPSIVKQAARGVNYLHQKGWIHRDLKPDNFLLNESGVVKLIDFAIADKIRTGFSKFLSGRPKVQGTRSYMSPEQIRGEYLEPVSDVYSFGCMLFEFFAGRPPFTGGSPDELLQKHLKAAIPAVGAHNEHISPEFADLITSMMNKKKEKRPSTMREFLKRIDNMRMIKIQRRT